MNGCRIGAWFWLMQKRIWKKPAFLLMMVILPVLVLLLTAASRSGSGILTIAVCDGGSRAGKQVVDRLLSTDSVLYFNRVKQAAEAEELVRTGAADAAWIIPADYEARLSHVTDRHPKALVQVLEQEENAFLSLIRIRFFAAIYPDISFVMYEDLTGSKYAGEIYMDDPVVTFATMDGELPKAGNGSYLTAPLRGLEAVLLLVCGLAGVLYYLQDERSGRFYRFPLGKRFLLSYGLVLLPVMDMALVILGTLALSGSLGDLQVEIPCMVLYGLSVTSFALFLGRFLSHPGKMGLVLPVLLLMTLGLAPVFFHIRLPGFVSWGIPAAFYLNAVHDRGMLSMQAMQTVGFFALDCAAFVITSAWRKYVSLHFI